MKNIIDYNNFLNEANLSNHPGIDYKLSRKGYNKNPAFGADIIFRPTQSQPEDDDEISWIRNSTFTFLKFRELKLKYPNTDFLFYNIVISGEISGYAIALKGLITNMLVQSNRVGGSKRGDYFRETVFLVVLAAEVWKSRKIGLDVRSRLGNIPMSYNVNDTMERVSTISNIKSDEYIQKFIDRYIEFIEFNEKAYETMKKHCKLLIDKLGDSIKNISYITKNHKDLMINIAANEFLKNEIEMKSEILSFSDLPYYRIYDIPNTTNISKWNPSDIWIVYDEWPMLYDTTKYSKKGIDTIDDLNGYLGDSITNKTGVIGVSLKLSIDKGNIGEINMDNTKIIDRYKDFKVKDTKKTSEIDFEYKEKGKWKEGSGMDVRTFTSSNKAGISLEIKGTKGGGYVSGKAGSMMNYLLKRFDPNLAEIKEIVKKGVNKEKIRNEIIKIGGIRIKNKKLEEIWNKDISGDEILGNYENSRLQSIIFIDWLHNLEPDLRNQITTDIVRFGKSESMWSAPHYVLK